jgi:hypothetical protein
LPKKLGSQLLFLSDVGPTPLELRGWGPCLCAETQSLWNPASCNSNLLIIWNKGFREKQKKKGKTVIGGVQTGHIKSKHA